MLILRFISKIVLSKVVRLYFSEVGPPVDLAALSVPTNLCIWPELELITSIAFRLGRCAAILARRVINPFVATRLVPPPQSVVLNAILKRPKQSVSCFKRSPSFPPCWQAHNITFIVSSTSSSEGGSKTNCQTASKTLSSHFFAKRKSEFGEFG